MNELGSYTRAPHLLGKFGEGLVTYTLIRKCFEVAVVDHVGADLIAERGETRIAVSVKTRLFKAKSSESRMVLIGDEHIEKLEHFAKRFGCFDPVFAHVVCIADENIIRLFMVRVKDVKQSLDKVKNGYSFRFSKKHLIDPNRLPYVDYSSWDEKSFGIKYFDLDAS